MRKNFEKKVLIISEGEIKEVKKYNLHKKDYQQYLQFLSKNKNELKLDMLINSKNELDKVEEYQFIVQKFIIYYIETLKLVSMILAMPYFSFQNEIGNLKVKLKKN